MTTAKSARQMIQLGALFAGSSLFLAHIGKRKAPPDSTTVRSQRAQLRPLLRSSYL